MAKKVIFGVLILAATVACADSRTTRDADGRASLGPQMISFLEGLNEGYGALSQSRARALDFGDAERFKAKAFQAGRGVSVLPDEVTDRYLQEWEVVEFGAILARLRDSFDLGARHLTPARAAKAQVGYDCWIEAAESHRSADVARCKRAFERAIVGVERAVAPRPSQNALMTSAPAPRASVPAPVSTSIPTPITAPIPTPAPTPAPPAPTLYAVHFAFDSAELSAAAERAVAAAVAKAENADVIDFSITGHADSAGSEQYNLDLSLRRANAVRDALMARGVKSNGISVAGRGEAEPAIPTDDGVREPENRRVEIIFL